ncbi:archaemetzincin family Zn-dependent metalloprotease [Hymenobacter coalescens]
MPKRCYWGAWLSCLLLSLGLLGCQARPRVIYLTSFGGLPAAQVRMVREAISAFYHVPVRLLPPQKLAATTYCPVRQRPRAALVLEQLTSLLPDTVDARTLALTVQDVEIESRPQPHWGVMGLANAIGGEACVVSTFRLAGRSDRLRKVSLHEIGHLMNLPHCRSGTPACLMNDAHGRGAVVDRARVLLCPACQARVAW